MLVKERGDENRRDSSVKGSQRQSGRPTHQIIASACSLACLQVA